MPRRTLSLSDSGRQVDGVLLVHRPQTWHRKPHAQKMATGSIVGELRSRVEDDMVNVAGLPPRAGSELSAAHLVGVRPSSPAPGTHDESLVRPPGHGRARGAWILSRYKDSSCGNYSRRQKVMIRLDGTLRTAGTFAVLWCRSRGGDLTSLRVPPPATPDRAC